MSADGAIQGGHGVNAHAPVEDTRDCGHFAVRCGEVAKALETLEASARATAPTSELVDRARSEVHRICTTVTRLMYLCLAVAVVALGVLGHDLERAAQSGSSQGQLVQSLRGFLLVIMLPALAYEALRRHMTPTGPPVLALIEALKLKDEASERSVRRHYAAAEAALRVTLPSGKYRTRVGRRWQLEGIAKAADEVGRLEFDLRPGAVARNRPTLVRVLTQLVLDLWVDSCTVQPSSPVGATTSSFVRSILGRLLTLALAIAALTPLVAYGPTVLDWLTGR